MEEDKTKAVGIVNIGSTDQAKVDHAYKYISDMMRTISVNDEFDGVVNRVESYGAFVNIAGTDAVIAAWESKPTEAPYPPASVWSVSKSAHGW